MSSAGCAEKGLFSKSAFVFSLMLKCDHEESGLYGKKGDRIILLSRDEGTCLGLRKIQERLSPHCIERRFPPKGPALPLSSGDRP